jgi:hypothetical protein
MNTENSFNEENGNSAKHLLYADIKVGMEVKDDEGDRSIVVDCSDIHNVEVQFILGGKALYCLDEKCKGFAPLFICI